MLCLKALIVLATCLPWSSGKLSKYCSVCEEHTMCKFHGIGEACENVGGGGVTPQERQEIVDVHNWLRRIVASGSETKGADGPQPQAANMMKLEWDDDLAQVAQRWADQCKFQHDTCRDDPRWRAGQNIYWKWSYPVHTVNWTDAILSWYSEVSLYKAKEVDSYRFQSTTGHYTQMMWHDTYLLGCGRRDYGQNKIYVCNYGPAGNWLGEPLYAVGKPCSQCPRGTHCDAYLCDSQNKTQSAATDTLELRIALADEEAPDSNNTHQERSLEGLTPPKETSRDAQGPENNQRQPEHAIPKDVLLDADEQHKTTNNSIDAEDIELDEDTRNDIEELKLSLERLVKRFLQRLRRAAH